ncbi:MAG: TetR/AcrR family transcriptional regulator [Candidatus Hermodarchaeota archaeon]
MILKKTLIMINHGTSLKIRDIAKEANVSVGTIYKYYPDGVQSILMQLVSQMSSTYFPETLYRNVNFNDFQSFLKRLISLILENHTKNKELVRLERSVSSSNIFIQNFIKNETLIDFLFKFNDIKGENKTVIMEKLEKLIVIIDIFIHKHIDNPLLDSEEAFIEFLSETSYNYLKKY